MKPRDTSLPSIVLGEVEAKKIIVEDRLRTVDKLKVTELAASIRATGLQNPIQLNREGDTYRLIAGAHRLAAMQEIWDEEREVGEAAASWLLPATVHTDLAHDDRLLMEIAENLHRNDLSADQRKEMSLEYGKLLLRNESICTDGTNKEKPKGAAKCWFTQWMEKANLKKTTANSWWKEFKAQTGETRSPCKAKDKAEEFFSFYHPLQAAKAAEAAKKKADREAQNARVAATNTPNRKAAAKTIRKEAKAAEPEEEVEPEEPDEEEVHLLWDDLLTSLEALVDLVGEAAVFDDLLENYNNR